MSEIACLLVALNATPGVSRALVPVLGGQTAWLRRLGRGRPRLGSRRVDHEHLQAIRARLARAGAIDREERERASDVGAEIVTRLDDGYPSSLLDLHQPPPVLYVRGELPDRPGVAIVGSRRSDPYGLEAAELFGRDLAHRGLTVVSGLARGVDSAGHKGALSVAGGRTVAVLGCGIDVEYPRRSARLAGDIARAGAVVSEFPTSTPPLAGHFPLRNRIIAALAIGTLVVRAEARSGSLITARLALELGRDVYALPGNIFDPRSIGPNTLIRDGALAVQHPREIVESLPSWVHADLEPFDEPEPVDVPPPEKRLRGVWKAVPRGEAVTVEAINKTTGKEIRDVLAILTELEIGGWIKREPGPSFRRQS